MNEAPVGPRASEVAWALNARRDPGTVLAVATRQPKQRKSAKISLFAAGDGHSDAERGKLVVGFAWPELERLHRVSAKAIEDVLAWSVFAWQHALAPEPQREEYLRAIARQVDDDHAHMVDRQMTRRRDLLADSKIALGPLRVEARGGYRYEVFAEPPYERGDA